MSGSIRRPRPFVVALLLLLVACGGPGGPPVEFDEADRWEGPVPAGATMVDADEFDRMLRSGELTMRSSADVAAQAAARDAQFVSDAEYLAPLADPSEAVQELLAAVGDQRTYVPDRTVELPDGQVVTLEGLGTQLRNAVESERLASSTENAHAVYSLAYELAPEEVRAQAEAPTGLTGASLGELEAALAALDALLAGVEGLDGTRLESSPVAPAAHAGLGAAAVGPGTGTEENRSCAAPTRFVAEHWFPLKNFLPPMKDQGRRGTCWAFASLGAVEVRERVQNDNPVNLSEQFLVNKVKEEWDESDYTEGYALSRALGLAAEEGQPLLEERGWTYNSSPNRASSADGQAASYAGTCDPYGQGADAGFCSETAHQSPPYCTTVIFTFCGYTRINFDGPGVPAGTTRQLWASGQAFNLNVLRQVLAQGHVVLASMPVYEGLFSADRGAITDYDRVHMVDGAEVAGSYGNHAVQIVGFLSNEELSNPSTTYEIGGGGYFIVKNSWGCAQGDGGYYYVPADYVSGRFNSLHVLDYDARRSEAWVNEQRNPGSAEAPAVSVTSPLTADLRVETNVAGNFRVTHSVTNSVELLVTSDRDGTLHDGPWSTDRFAFPTPLPYTFTSVGSRTLTIRASYAGRVTERSLLVNVVNTAPTVSLSGSGTAFVGEPYTVTATVGDRNGESTADLCARTAWSVEAGDALSATTGCQVQVTFGATGAHTVSATTTDSEGLATDASLSAQVEPPPENPFPRVSAAGVEARALVPLGAGGAICTTRDVPQGQTIDLNATGCQLIGETGNPPLYRAYVTVENPDAEALTYDWRAYVLEDGVERVLAASLGSTSATYSPGFRGNTNPITSSCRMTVTVNAPDPARSKQLTVWTGSCTYYATFVG